MFIDRISLVLFLLVLCASACLADDVPAASLQGCINYEPDTVTLVGTISRRAFINASDQKEVHWILRLAKPVCVKADEGSDFNVERSRVTDVQLLLEPDMFTEYRRMLGKKVKATGRLFGEHTAHHFTPVLLDVTNVSHFR